MTMAEEIAAVRHLHDTGDPDGDVSLTLEGIEVNANALQDAVLRFHEDHCTPWPPRFCEHEMCRIAAGE